MPAENELEPLEKMKFEKPFELLNPDEKPVKL
jgi:hypothetical protein